MKTEEKRLLELASVELGYAQLEVQFADQTKDSLSRIGYHLCELEKHLEALMGSIEGVGAQLDEPAHCFNRPA